MFGYTTDETEEYMPFSFLMATKLTNKFSQVLKDKILTWLLPDGKTEVTVEYEKKENSSKTNKKRKYINKLSTSS